MSTATDDSARLGERLLKLVPTPSQDSDTPRQSRGHLFSKLLRLGRKETLGRLAVIATLSALCGTGVLLLLNAEAKTVEGHAYSIRMAVLFAVVLVIYRTSQRQLVRSAAAAIEKALDLKRQDSVSSVLRFSLRDLEQMETQRLRDGLAGHYGSLSQTLVPIISGVEGLILLVFMFGYVLYLSVFAGVLTAIVVSLTVIGYLNRSKEMEAEMASSAQAEARFRALTEAIARGAKELQLNTSRREAVLEQICANSSKLAQGRSVSAAQFGDLIATANSISYLMAGAVVFLIPLLTSQESSDISRTVLAVIFLLGPIGSVVQTIQQLATAQFALAAISGFESEIAELQRRSPATDTPPGLSFDHFERIRLDAVHYRHLQHQGTGFAIDIDQLELSRGQITFITGGNGSGKTTLLRVLTGLYPRGGGTLTFNDQTLPPMPPQGYRELFASVFVDFHLFDQPYGLDAEGYDIFDAWLRRLQVREKLGDDLSCMDTESLSTGQRKRVALALALAERRPILVLDEWAADQDPQTRQRFYEEILPQLKADGCTVFAITHDEQYFHCCDQRIHMLEGRLLQGEAA